MKRRPGELLRHARYIAFAGKAVAAINRDWRTRRGAVGGRLLTRAEFHRHLLTWAMEQGYLPVPENPIPESPSFLVSEVYDTYRSPLVEEARSYWRSRVHEVLSS